MRVIADPREDVAEVLERIDGPCFAGCHECVESSDVLSGAKVTDEEVVLAAERHAT